jgi:murein DD-endopeptidase MepM/ murein hydrolase activator NlpD
MRPRTPISIAIGALVLLVSPVASATASAPTTSATAAASTPRADRIELVAAQVLAPAPTTTTSTTAPPPPPNPHDPGQFTNPIHGGHVISPFGRRSGRPHEGIDYKGPYKTTVMATFPGTVIQAGPGLSGYGNTVTVDNGDGVTTLFAHLFSVSAHKGEQVTWGTPIGLEGQTGSASTYHVHYEVREHGVPRNPAPYLKPE